MPCLPYVEKKPKSHYEISSRPVTINAWTPASLAAILFAGMMTVTGCGDGGNNIRAPMNPKPLPAPSLDEGVGFRAPATVRPILEDSQTSAEGQIP